MKRTSTLLATTLSALIVLMAAPSAMADPGKGTYNPKEVQILMFDLLYEIEEAAGLEHKASAAINGLDEQSQQMFLDAISDKEGFVSSLQGAKQLKSLAHVMSTKAHSDLPTMSVNKMESSTPYEPDYPPSNNAAYVFVKALGLTPRYSYRCSSSGFEYYRAALIGLQETQAFFDATCTVAGCDPTGVFCLIDCAAAEITGLAVHYARLPVEACEAHDGNVNSAELEAAFENTVSILTDVGALATDLDNHDQRLTGYANTLSNDINNHDQRLTGYATAISNDLNNHDQRLTGYATAISNDLNNHDNHLTVHDGNLSTHDAAIKALLADTLANQQEIIMLLKTPQGNRPGWREDGYRSNDK